MIDTKNLVFESVNGEMSMSKDKIVNFIKDFVLMIVIISIVEFIFYKLGFLSSFSFAYIVGFMIGWVIVQMIKYLVDNKKRK